MSDTATVQDRLADELDDTRDHVDARQKLVRPTADEIKNGWTAETLTDYIAERTAGAELKNDPHSLQRRREARPKRQRSKYNPHRWR